MDGHPSTSTPSAATSLNEETVAGVVWR